jgi:hypothetical protein
MLLKKLAVWIGLAALCGAGCDKGQSTTPAAGSGQASSGAVVGAAAAAGASAASVSTLVGTYHAYSQVDGEPGARRAQSLILNADRSVELDTTIENPAKRPPSTSDKALGTYTAGPKEVVATFTTKDGKPIPASDEKRALKLTRDAGDKALVADGRTYERAK